MFRIPAVQIMLVSKSCTILFRAPTEGDACFLRSFYSFVLVFFASFGAHVGCKVTSWLLKLQEDKCVCVCICISISHFKHSAVLHTWFRAVLYFLGLRMHLSLSSGGSTFPFFCFMSKADICRGIVLAYDRHVWLSLAIHHCSLADS